VTTKPLGSDARSKILNEAIGIVYREGPGRVTMRSLAEKLGYSAASIYLHFESKEELLKEIALYGFDALEAAMAPAADVEDPAEAVAEAARRYIEFGLEHPELYRLMFQEIMLADRLSPLERSRALRAWSISIEIYARGIASGRFRASDARTEASIGWACVHGFVQLALAGKLPGAALGTPEFRRVREELVGARLRALRMAE
jgi:AcrR family transcriptional regulator